MSDRYPAAWCEVHGPLKAGVLVLEADSFRLEGRSAGVAVTETVAYDSVDGVHVGRDAEERINGRASIVVDRRGLPPLLIEPHGLGLVGEVADALALLTAAATTETDDEVVVVVPLRRGQAAKARELVASGPPFDPAMIGLSEHQVFVTEYEAVFVFAGHGIREALARVVREPGLWRAGLAWRAVAAGPPRLADAVYGWAQPPGGAAPT